MLLHRCEGRCALLSSIEVSFLPRLPLSDTVLRRNAVAQVPQAIHHAEYYPRHEHVQRGLGYSKPKYL
jgi:hypothetical protein